MPPLTSFSPSHHSPPLTSNSPTHLIGGVSIPNDEFSILRGTHQVSKGWGGRQQHSMLQSAHQHLIQTHGVVPAECTIQMFSPDHTRSMAHTLYKHGMHSVARNHCIETLYHWLWITSHNQTKAASASISTLTNHRKVSWLTFQPIHVLAILTYRESLSIPKSSVHVMQHQQTHFMHMHAP